MRHLSLVRSPSRTSAEPAPEQSDQPVAYVPVKLLLAASGRCSCDECCQAAMRPATPVRPARGTDRQPVRNIHLLS